jgi:phosphoglycerate dehydrogenase-like enzyme
LDLAKLMAEADIVSIHLGFNEQTAGIITAEHLNQLRPGSTVVNTARAEVVEPGAMYQRMARGDVSGAFDVFEIEPLPKGDPMAQLANVIKTSHNAFRTPETTYSMIDLGIRNIEGFISGNPVNIV